VNGKSVKASREVKPGDKISLRRGPVTFSYDVLECPKSRVAASMVNAFARDVTTAAELEKLNKIREIRANNTLRLPGRPTKRDRRDLEEFLDEQWSDES
jgi:ribosome-associated heat shock protein Hsp15